MVLTSAEVFLKLSAVQGIKITMVLLLFAVIAAYIIYRIIKAKKKSALQQLGNSTKAGIVESTIEPPIKVQLDQKLENTTSFKIDMPIKTQETKLFTNIHTEIKDNNLSQIKKDQNGNWTLNPNAPFELSLINADGNLAEQIKGLLDGDNYNYDIQQKLVAIFAEHNIKVKQIEDYKDKYKHQYFAKIDELKNSTTEWNEAGERDKEDMLVDFRHIAINGIYERPNCDLSVLFENEPNDITIDDELIKEYGLDNFRTYLNYANSLEKIRIVPNDSYSRQNFENLAKMGLALRGNDLPLDEVLTTLTLKQLNSIANNSVKEFKRKNQAIEYIINIENIKQTIGEYVSLRELFKLQPLPDKYQEINLKDIASTWNYHNEEIKILIDTYNSSTSAYRSREFIDSASLFQIVPLNNCPCAYDRSKRTYTKNDLPVVPFHIGCKCFLQVKLDND